MLVWNSAEGSFSYTLNVPETGLYCVQASYCPIVSNTAEISVSLAIDGEVPYDTASRLKLNKVYQNQSEIKTDDSGNQVRPTQEQTELWQTSWIGDSDGLFNDPVFFYLEKGTHEITLSSQKAYSPWNPCALHSRTKFPPMRNIPTASMLRCPRKIHPPALSASRRKRPC